MKHIKTALAVGIVSALVNGVALAGAWDVIQDVDVSATTPGGTTVTQTDSATSATQSLNKINLGAGDSVNAGSTQTITSTDVGVTLLQDGTTGNNAANQAGNRVVIENVTNMTQSAVLGTGAATLTQDALTVDSRQIMNDAAVSATVTDMTQTVTGQASTMTQSATGSGNTQAMNAISAGTAAAAATQSVTDAGSLTMNQGASGTNAGAGNVQAGNVIMSDSVGVTGTPTDQDVTADGLAMNQYATTALQAGNAVVPSAVGAGSGAIDQKITSGATGVAMLQTSGVNAVQAGNYLGTVPATP